VSYIVARMNLCASTRRRLLIHNPFSLGAILKKSSLIMLFSAFSLFAASSVYAQTPAKMLPLAVEVDVVTVFVMDVDLQNRTIELKDTNGNLFQMKVSKQVNDLDKVKKGDVFVVESAQAIAIGLVAAPKGKSQVFPVCVL